jgi:hypothetical protein
MSRMNRLHVFIAGHAYFYDSIIIITTTTTKHTDDPNYNNNTVIIIFNPEPMGVASSPSFRDAATAHRPNCYINYSVHLSVHEDVTPRGVNPPLQFLLPLNLTIVAVPM